MTDNDKEIVQTLKNHIEAEDCVTCESFGKCDEFLLTKNTLDLINRQQAEIERLNSLVDDHFWGFCSIAGCEGASNDCWKTCPDSHYNKIKNEVVKEFAERLKDKSLTKWDYHDAVDIEEIDNLVKEMVGDKE